MLHAGGKNAYIKQEISSSKVMLPKYAGMLTGASAALMLSYV